MTAIDVFLEWTYLVNQGAKEASFKQISDDDVKQLKNYESRHIKDAKIWNQNGNTYIRLL
jgi:hypothetical protein